MRAPSHPRWSRRELLVGLLASTTAPAWAGASPTPDRRSWPGRGRITVLATTYGDLRLRRPSDEGDATRLAARLADEERHIVAASGVPPQDPPVASDLARVLAGERPALSLHEAPTDDFEPFKALMRVVFALAEPHNGAAMSRRIALAQSPFGLQHPAITNYAKLVGDALERRDRVREGAEARARQLATTLPRKALVVTRALGAEALCAALEAAGRGGRLVTTEAAADLIDTEPLFWAGVQAGLPAPGDDGLAPWAAAWGDYHAAVTAWPGLEAFHAEIQARQQPTPPLTGALLDHVLEASAALRGVGLLGIPEGLNLRVGPEGLHAMAYDSYDHLLKVSPTIGQVSVPMAAAVLYHELVHVADVQRAATALGTTPRGVAVLLNRLPFGVAVGARASMEDRAYRLELDAAAALDLALPDPERAPTADDPPELQLGQILAMLQHAGPGSPVWLSMIDAMVAAPPR